MNNHKTFPLQANVEVHTVTPAEARAEAPASVGNIGVGFDILGHSLQGIVDRAIVRRIDTPGVRISRIDGCDTPLPHEPEKNTAGTALLALSKTLQLPFGFDLQLQKGIPLSAGMGGSAASAVAALLAANALLDNPLPREALYPFALTGESIASGDKHGDNLGPALLGGLVLATAERLLPIAVPATWHCALVHPHLLLETRKARTAVAGDYPLKTFVTQSGNLALLLAGCFCGDAELVRAGFNDVLIEPRRAKLIPGFAQVKQAALDHHAMGATISGGGPSVFGWFTNRKQASAAALAMRTAFRNAGFDSDSFISPINAATENKRN